MQRTRGSTAAPRRPCDAASGEPSTHHETASQAQATPMTPAAAGSSPSPLHGSQASAGGPRPCSVPLACKRHAAAGRACSATALASLALVASVRVAVLLPTHVPVARCCSCCAGVVAARCVHRAWHGCWGHGVARCHGSWVAGIACGAGGGHTGLSAPHRLQPGGGWVGRWGAGLGVVARGHRSTVHSIL